MPRPFHDLFELAGRVAIVTGGTGILGTRYCHGLAEFGAHVVVADLDAGPTSALARELTQSYGQRCLGVVADVADPSSVAALVAAVEAAFGRIDVLMNNAVTKGPDLAAMFAPTFDYDPATWRALMAVNLDGMFLVARAVGRHMVAAGRGSIVNVSSIYGNVGPDQRIYEGSEYLGRPINTPAVYSTAKAAVLGLTRHLAAEWGGHGVRVNTLTPGGVSSGQNDVFAARYGARNPLGRMARADEMVGALLFLASDASSYVTGHNLIVDGGWTAW